MTWASLDAGVSQIIGQQSHSGSVAYHLPQTLQVTPAGTLRYSDVVTGASGTPMSSFAFSDCLSSSCGDSGCRTGGGGGGGAGDGMMSP